MAEDLIKKERETSGLVACFETLPLLVWLWRSLHSDTLHQEHTGTISTVVVAQPLTHFKLRSVARNNNDDLQESVKWLKSCLSKQLWCLFDSWCPSWSAFPVSDNLYLTSIWTNNWWFDLVIQMESPGEKYVPVIRTLLFYLSALLIIWLLIWPDHNTQTLISVVMVWNHSCSGCRLMHCTVSYMTEWNSIPVIQ